MIKIIDNPDIELCQSAEEALNNMKNIYGKRYCPCSLQIKDSNICPCEDFRYQNNSGECNCGRYLKIVD